MAQWPTVGWSWCEGRRAGCGCSLYLYLYRVLTMSRGLDDFMLSHLR